MLHFIGCATIQTWSGVDLFFVLSGFLIGGILIDAKGSEHYFRTFYIRRAFRILPIYTVACLAYFPVARLTAYAFHAAGMKAAMPWYIYATFTQNFWLANGRWYVWLSPTWSLAIEEQFYLTLPLLIWMLPARNLRKTLIAGVAAIFVFRYAMFLHYPKWSPAAFYVLAPFRADGLLMGVIGARSGTVGRRPGAAAVADPRGSCAGWVPGVCNLGRLGGHESMDVDSRL